MRYLVWTTTPEHGVTLEAASGFDARKMFARGAGLDVVQVMARRIDGPNLDIRYADDPTLIHDREGNHAATGRMVALYLDAHLRRQAMNDGRKTYEEGATDRICPGCYTLILIHTLLELARDNGDSLEERCAFAAREFARLAEEARQGKPLLVAIDGD